ncbi:MULTISPECIES: type II toxin-antitoxin system RelB/DinJ family antitoxin [Pasteurellaceae]|uniref:type II toxin-antitoxin system RelB/DinJ family antitoxin n=1 Tax=Pasteurellaceae TaxID=712 RepID=UPI0009B99A50|nr:type II toxin-antitoxin system RelB/DinJ family antitoxin [Mannheimia haemolytica]
MKVNKCVEVKVRLDKELKEQVTKELNFMGLTMSDAIRLYLSYVARKKKIPAEFTENS